LHVSTPGCAIAAATAATVPKAVAETLPLDWREISYVPEKYDVNLDPAAAYEAHYGASIVRVTPTRNTDEFGGLIQAARAEPWRGRRILLRGWIKTENAGYGAMWLRIDSNRRSLALDNMNRRPIEGTTGWTEYQIVLDVPATAKYLVYGAFLAGTGRLDVDNISFSIAPPGTETTPHFGPLQLLPPPGSEYMPPSVVLSAPSNLQFEWLDAGAPESVR
jgi:hypothetical protein